MIAIKELKRWLSTLPGDCRIGIAVAPKMVEALEYGFAVGNAPTFEWEAFSEFLRMTHLALVDAGYEEEEIAV